MEHTNNDENTLDIFYVYENKINKSKVYMPILFNENLIIGTLDIFDRISFDMKQEM